MTMRKSAVRREIKDDSAKREGKARRMGMGISKARGLPAAGRIYGSKLTRVAEEVDHAHRVGSRTTRLNCRRGALRRHHIEGRGAASAAARRRMCRAML